MNDAEMNQVATEVLEACRLEGGKLVLDDDEFLGFGQRIRAADDRRDWATALIALVNRLRALPGTGPAAERVNALAALALGDPELNQLVAKATARR